MNSMIVTLGTRREIHLPHQTLRALSLRKGAKFNVRISHGIVMLIPSTDAWQKMEREADAAIENGEMIGPYKKIETAIRALRRAKA